MSAAPIERLRAIMARLRDPDGGCPWDVQQSFASIAPYTTRSAMDFLPSFMMPFTIWVTSVDWNFGSGLRSRFSAALRRAITSSPSQRAYRPCPRPRPGRASDA